MSEEIRALCPTPRRRGDEATECDELILVCHHESTILLHVFRLTHTARGRMRMSVDIGSQITRHPYLQEKEVAADMTLTASLAYAHDNR